MRNFNFEILFEWLMLKNLFNLFLMINVFIICIYFNLRRIRLIYLEKKLYRECFILRKDIFFVVLEIVILFLVILCFWDFIIVWKINRILVEL